MFSRGFPIKLFPLNINMSAVSYQPTGPRSTETFTYENRNHGIIGLFDNNISKNII